MEDQLYLEIREHVENSNKIKKDIIDNIDYHMFIAKANENDDAMDILDGILFSMNYTADDLIIRDEHELIDLIYSKMDWLG